METGESWTIPEASIVNARTRHPCRVCFEKIEAGERCWRFRVSEPNDLLVIEYEHTNCVKERALHGHKC